MIQLFSFKFYDIKDTIYEIKIYDSESDDYVDVIEGKLVGNYGCILNYEKENTDYVVGGIIKSDLTFSVLNENGILNDFIKKLQLYENRYLVELKQVESIKFRGVLLNDFGTFEDNKIQVIEFQATDGLGLLQNIEYVDDIQIGNSINGHYYSWALGNGIIDVISRALSFNPITKIFKNGEWYISYKTDYRTADMLQGWDALNYTNVLKRRDDVTYYVTPFADYEIKKTLSGVEYKVYEYKNCYDVIDSCLKLFNLCLVQNNGFWNIFSIKYLEENKDNYNYFKLTYENLSYYKNLKIKDEYQSTINTLNINNNEGYRGDGNFSLNTVIKKIRQKFIPFYVKEGVYNNLIYSGNHGGDLQWYSYPAGVITGFSEGKTIKESNFDDWSLCSKYHYHNFINAGDSISNLQFLINFTIKYAHENWSGHRHIQNAKLKMDLNLNVNGKWLDNNGNWVDSLPASNWWHQFSSVVDGYDGDVVFNFNKYFAVGIPNPEMGCGVDFYFRIYEDVNLTGYDSFTKIANIQNNSVLKIVDVNGNDIEYIDYFAENGAGILDIELDESFVDNFSESAANNVLLVATNELSNNVYYYEKSDKWLFEGESIYDMKNLTEKRLSEIAAMNSHPLLKWEGNIYYKNYTDINYLQFYLIRYNLALQHYVMFPQRISFYIRKMMATAELIEISRDFLSIASGGNLQVGKYNVPHSDVPGVINNEVTDVVANQISIVATGSDSIMRINNVDNKEIYKVYFDDINNKIVVSDNENDLLTIDNTGIHYINENEIGRYMQDSIAKYDKYDFAIIECFLEDNIEIAFPDYTYFNGLRAFPVNEIKNTVFRYIKFTGDFVMDNLEVANDYEFYSSVFTSDFNCPNLKTIGQYAFRYSQFTGDFNCPNLHTIGQYAFYLSVFTGNFNCPNLQTVGYSAFYYSQFNGEFNCPNLQTIRNNAFAVSQFTGEFNCQKVQAVGNYAFRNCIFTGDFNCPNLQEVGYYAFQNSQFNGVFNCPDLQSVGNSAFRDSEFNGSFNCPACEEIGQDSFLNSTFTTITIGANANLGTGCIGAHSAEFINDYAANGKLAGTYVWDAGTNHWIYQG